MTSAIGGPFLVAVFPGRRYSREVTRILVNGPSGSLISGYRGFLTDNMRFTTAGRGDFNENDLDQPVDIPIGWQIYMVWNVASGVASATLMFRAPGYGGF